MTEADTTTPNSTVAQSFLIADCGHVNTTLALFDAAIDSYRLIARATVGTTAGAPWNDISLGVRQAMRQLTIITGRPLLNENNSLIKPARPDGAGVDHFAITISAAPPVQTILIGLADDVSLSSARRALDNIYYYEADTFRFSDDRDEKAQVAAYLQIQPDLVFITGGTDGGAEQRLLQLIEGASLGVNVLSKIKKPQVVYAGNIELRERVRQIMGNKVQLLVADNVRPHLDEENLDDAIKIVSTLYERQVATMPGMEILQKWSGVTPQPTAQSFAAVGDYFAALNKGCIVGIDLGSHTVTLIVADPEKRDLTINAEMGIGFVAKLLAKSTLAEIERWLPVEMEETAVRDYIYNKALHPQLIPTTESDLFLDQAAAREIMRHVVHDSMKQWTQSENGRLPPFQLLLARGSALTNAPRAGQTILMLLDALQPTGIFAVALDRYGILPALGMLAEMEPLAAVQVLESVVLDNLGWVVVPVGKGQPGQTVLSVTMNSDLDTALEVEVAYGTIEVIPLEPGDKIEVLLTPARRFDIGLGQGKPQKFTAQSGSVGLIVDARGRPLAIPEDDEERRDLIRKWIWDVGG